MIHVALPGALVLLLTLNQWVSGYSVQSPAQEKANPDEIKKLIEQLGSPKFSEREEASQQLQKIGQPTLDALRKAAESKDAEVRRRAKELVRIISPDVREAPWEKLLNEGINEERARKDYKKAIEILTKAEEIAKGQLHPNQLAPATDIPILTDIYLHLARCHYALREWEKAGDSYNRAKYYSNSNQEVRKQIDREWSEMTDGLLSDWKKIINKKIAKDADLVKLTGKHPMVILHSRRFAGGSYFKSSYSFNYETAEEGKHNNDVQLQFDNGTGEKTFEINMLTNQRNLVTDLGKVEFNKEPDPNKLTEKEMKAWEKGNCKALEGHTYLEKIEDDRGNKFFVLFQIIAVDQDSNYMAFVWRRLPGGAVKKP
jgi:tetratricopeptide (TPR) repeat protein